MVNSISGLEVEWASWSIYRLRRGRGKASADLFWQDGYRCACGEKPWWGSLTGKFNVLGLDMTQERHPWVNLCENMLHNQHIDREGMHVHVASLGIL